MKEFLRYNLPQKLDGTKLMPREMYVYPTTKWSVYFAISDSNETNRVVLNTTDKHGRLFTH
jgi:hypothetical protein